MKRLMLVSILSLSAAALASAATTCTYLTSGTRMVLQADCTTDAPIVIPNGMTHDGAGHRITAVDPPGDNFRGAILEAAGLSADVVNTVIATDGLANFCAEGADRLAAIRFDGAAGSIRGNTILSVNKNPSGGRSSCQEGNAIEVANFTSPGRLSINIQGNTIREYQKNGILLRGDVDGIITDNAIAGAGPQGVIGQNGIVLASGASAHILRNRVSGNAYTGSGWASGGIVVDSGPLHGTNYSFGVDIESNTLVGNDVGVWLMQMNARKQSPETPTRARVANNLIQNDAVTNGYTYQAGIVDHGNRDVIEGNKIVGAGYDSASAPGKIRAIDDYRQD
ncbi:MAG TPA: right-handed parallel beta-helix repeat-containing protein [Bryobacteraceae bacterium]|nr:right-handed parallel beta-helix repeat-containing protein [Bryobacteraceae bacterium]